MQHRLVVCLCRDFASLEFAKADTLIMQQDTAEDTKTVADILEGVLGDMAAAAAAVRLICMGSSLDRGEISGASNSNA